MKPLSVSPLSAARAAAAAAASCSAAAAATAAEEKRKYRSERSTVNSDTSNTGSTTDRSSSTTFDHRRNNHGKKVFAASAFSFSSQSEWMRRVEAKVHALLQHLLIADAYPRCLIQVTVMVLQDDGGAEAACINAAVAAAIDAGLPLRCRAWAMQVASLRRPHMAQQQQELHWRRYNSPHTHNPHLEHFHEEKHSDKQTEEGKERQINEAENPVGGETQQLLVDLCKEEEEGARRTASINFVLEPRTGDLVSAFRTSGSSSSSYTGGCSSRSTPALCEAGLVEILEPAVNIGGVKDSLNFCGITTGQWVAGDSAFGELLLAALAACREVDMHARLAVEAKLALATRTFSFNNFWWMQQHEQEDEEDD